MDPKIILIEGVSLKMKYPIIIPKIIIVYRNGKVDEIFATLIAKTEK
jgi:hypothetical protein